MVVDTLETELRILELQKRLAAQLQVGMLLFDSVCEASLARRVIRHSQPHGLGLADRR